MNYTCVITTDVRMSPFSYSYFSVHEWLYLYISWMNKSINTAEICRSVSDLRACWNMTYREDPLTHILNRVSHSKGCVFSLMQSHHNNTKLICKFEPIIKGVLVQQHRNNLSHWMRCCSSDALAYKWWPYQKSDNTLINLQDHLADSIMQ